jgi:bifunctional pyridoxal-dependent enzyme with beta-cystathionase and maltose regulon repressor activities
MTTCEQGFEINPNSEGELRNELERRNFVRAAELAALLGDGELRQIQLQALWQIASARNAPGMKRLAAQYGIPMSELRRYLKDEANQLKERGDHKALGVSYDATTGKYLSFEDWLNLHMTEKR